MSDFGANIFDDRHPAPEPARRRKGERAAPAAPTPSAPAEPAHVQEVLLKQPNVELDEGKDLGFEAPPAPARAPAPPPTPAPPPHAELPPERDDDRSRPADRGDHTPRPQAQRQPEPRRDRDRRDPPGRGGWRDERPRDEDHPSRPRFDDRHQRPAQDRPARPQPPRPAADTRPRPRASIAILVDLLALQAEARGQGGELALHRLRGGIVGDRACSQAICYAPRGITPPNGFELRPNEDNVGGIGLAAAALELASSGAELVLAPPSPAIRQLAAALRKAGHRIELAGFAPPVDDGHPVRRLGRDCLFVP